MTEIECVVRGEFRRHAPAEFISPVAACALMLGVLLTSQATAICPTFGLPSGSEIAEIQTSEGQICIELLRNDAPVTVQNFASYITAGDYDGTIIHRSVPGFVIQGGGVKQSGDLLSAIPTSPAIVNEPCTIEPGEVVCTTRGNERGTVAMARVGSQIDSATSQFYINLVDNRASLDTTNEGYTVFGNILGTGMTVADDIAASPVVHQDDAWWLAPEIGFWLLSLPVRNLVPLDLTPFGCWDPTNIALVVDPLDHQSPFPDPIYASGFFPLSGSCGTQIPRYSFTENPGSQSCPASDVLTTAVSGLNSLQIPIDPGTGDFLQFEFTCEEVSEALAQRDLWRADYVSRLSPEVIRVQSVHYQTVPEPGMSVALASGLLALVAFGRTRSSAFRDR